MTYAADPFDNVKDSMYPECAVHNFNVNSLVKEHKLFYGESLVESVEFFLTDDLHNVHEVQKDDNSGHDRLTTDDMVDVVNNTMAAIKPGSHEHVLCSTLQFRQWFNAPEKEA